MNRLPANLAAAVDAAIARDPRIRNRLAGLDAAQRDHVRRTIAEAIQAKLRAGGGTQ
ncbi:hypothetical protein ACCC88_16160 [Sphingomonas sp. Sphisp140]|uniref:hypothetical protein n=1 Tax=Sphingomonas TaxID=13687 RepID=UPI002780C9B9|nr:hypothetical protein [Sphingomonas kyeonggiensis]MDQ0252252.1 hypothetical protein [Sphingomonas kyeonggiensis]